MGEEENTLLDDFHISLQDELYLEGRINILQKLRLLIIFQRRLFGL